jgi:hypothetical protein
MPTSKDPDIQDLLDDNLNMLTRRGQCLAALKEMKVRDLEWKQTDPIAYKQDMQDLCRKIYGDAWQPQYEILMREEFPEQFGGNS